MQISVNPIRRFLGFAIAGFHVADIKALAHYHTVSIFDNVNHRWFGSLSVAAFVRFVISFISVVFKNGIYKGVILPT